MKTIQEVYELYTYNLDILKECYTFDSIRFLTLSAMNISEKLDAEKIQYCQELIKKHTKFFSNFRGWMQMPLSVKLSLMDNPEEELEKMLEVYRLFKEEFAATNFLVLAASIVYDYASLEDMPAYVEKAKVIYRGMKDNHPFLTSSEDHVLAIVLAFSNKDADVMIQEMEEFYTILKSEVSNNVAQMLSQIFVLSDTPHQTLQAMLDLKQQLEDKGLKLGKYYEVCPLAAVAFSNENCIEAICEADALLQQHPSYKGMFGIDKRTRAMHAAMLATSIYGNEDVANMASLTQIIRELINQQVLLCCMIAATSAAS